MWNTNSPFPFYYVFYQCPIPPTASHDPSSLLPKEGETIEHDLSLPSLPTQQAQPQQSHTRNRTNRRLSVREKQRRKRVDNH